MPIRAVVFDIGETLVDEGRLWDGWADYLGVPRGQFRSRLEDVIADGQHHAHVFERYRPKGFDIDAARRDRAERGDPDLFSAADLYADAVPCLRRLRELGLTIGIAANQPAEAEAVLREAGIDADFIATSAIWGVAKPSTAFFEKVVEAAGVPARDIVYVGDRLDNDVLPAREAGMVTAFLERGPWGRAHASLPEARLAHMRIPDLAKLPEALARLGGLSPAPAPAGERTTPRREGRRAVAQAKARTMTGGMAIVEALIANGVDTVFGLPGAQLYPLFDALQQHERAIRTIGARHEQACGYMAFGYARSTGRPGVFAVVPGPGVLNTTAALCTAAGCCAPVLCITGQVPSAFLGRGRGHLHELPDQLATLRTLVKWAARIERPADAPEIVNEAFRQMLSGRPGPVAIEMAWDSMAQSAVVEPASAAVIPKPPAPSPLEVEAAARLLAAAKAPMIMTGSGAQHASEAVRALAEELDAPVAAFRGGRGVLAEDHPLGISSYAAFRLWPGTDALVAIGTRTEMPYMRWTGMMTLIERPAAPPHLIRIDIDPAEMRRLVPHAGIVADSDAGTRALLAEVRRLRPRKGASRSPAGKAPSPARARIAAAKEEARTEIEKVQPQIAYLDVIREVLPREGFFVTELSQMGFTSYFGYPVHAPRTYVSEGYQGTLGFGFPSALGVKVAHPDKPVVSVTGDGGFLFGVQELATAAQYGIALVTLVFNNASYGNVLRDQKTAFGNRVIGAALANPDFMQLAKSFGVEAHRVASPAALRPVLKKALAAKGPVLIEVQVPQGSEVSPWEFIHPKRQ